jgi:hypothetical protein
MRAGRCGAAVLLLSILGWHGSAAGMTVSEVRQSPITEVPATSMCLARCIRLEVQCEEYERLRPTCSTINICFEEKRQCDALCRARAMLSRRACA